MTCCPPVEEEPRYECMKYRIQLPARSAACKDPDLYCKFRTSCMIHFLEKEKARTASK